MEEKDKTMSRRKALKILSATAGATTLSLLPTWDKPLVGVGALPAFAQASPVLGTGDFQATLTWNTGCPTPGCSPAVDIDLHVIEPNGTHVYYSNQIGTTARLDIDNVWGLGPENIFVPAATAAAGTYRVYVVYYSGAAATTATIRITVFANTPQQRVQTFTRSMPATTGVSYNVCNVVYPAGTITELMGTGVFVGVPK